MAVNVTHGWWESSCKRHTHALSLAKVSIARAKGTDPEVLAAYFDLYEKVVVEYDTINKAAHIFNVDETGMPMDYLPPKVWCKSGTKTACITTGRKTQVTVVGCANAARYCIPPMVIRNVKTMQGRHDHWGSALCMPFLTLGG